MRHGYVVRAGAMLAALFVLAACGEDKPVANASDSGAGQQAAPAPQAAAPVAVQPQGPQPGTQEHFVLSVGDRVFFDYDKYDVKPEAREVLRQQVAYLSRFPAKAVIVEGHCDERGTREYNLGLGERRANAVKEYMVSLGLPAARITTISYGKERPVALGHTDQAWSQNRRGVTVIAN
ncbi:MAG: peptidoglycan-associated lipoprotein Pal [Pseudomonadota bacterium]|nr:peptidoglycan-associated lipoprotein Pal [Pseudomonadota bacterium]